MHYNFIRIHKMLRVTPAMEAGATDGLWTLEDIVNLLLGPVPKLRGPYKKRKRQRDTNEQRLRFGETESLCV